MFEQKFLWSFIDFFCFLYTQFSRKANWKKWSFTKLKDLKICVIYRLGNHLSIMFQTWDIKIWSFHSSVNFHIYLIFLAWNFHYLAFESNRLKMLRCLYSGGTDPHNTSAYDEWLCGIYIHTYMRQVYYLRSIGNCTEKEVSCEIFLNLFLKLCVFNAVFIKCVVETRKGKIHIFILKGNYYLNFN